MNLDNNIFINNLKVLDFNFIEILNKTKLYKLNNSLKFF